MKTNTKLPENFKRMTDQHFNMINDKINTDYSDMMKKAVKHAKGAILNTDEYEGEEEKDDRIEQALANVRAAIELTDNFDVLTQLMSAEHHLTREQPIKKVSQLKYKDGKLWEICQQRSK